MIILRNIFLLFFSLLISEMYAQELHLQYENTPLNKVLISVRDSNELQLSFDDKLLSKYEITIDTTFSSPEKAITYLITPHGLAMEQDNGVYVIYKIKSPKWQKQFLLSGQITDITNGEPLPYSYIIVNGKTLATDVKGTFSFLSEEDSIFSV